LKVGELSSGCESRPVKAEPGRPEAGSALEGVTPKRCVSVRACGPWMVSPENAEVPTAEAVTLVEGRSAEPEGGRGTGAVGGVSGHGTHERGQPRNLGDPRHSAEAVGPKQGEPERRPKGTWESEGRIGAEKSGNGWHPDPAEQRRPEPEVSFMREP
jgi:hypothetical protein